ncbi:hypothetical protein JX265_008228 [Neoarthrinium moseri]|uniref:Uncharacterized protein n=1 Tax=Neoarthrinium moseri TaxID=1658444 RepID=A0A9P9WIP4_9PEZI|nr:hypothetical protein JX265_008228 [Neoarthrinium moseri]
MQLTSYLVVLPMLASLAAAAAAAASPSSGQQCWAGAGIHSACEGFTSGCTPDGMKVVCQGQSMIWNEMCQTPEGDYTCHYDADCNAASLTVRVSKGIQSGTHARIIPTANIDAVKYNPDTAVKLP